MKKRFELVLSKEQDDTLKILTKSHGFRSKGEYVRFILFMEKNVTEKIDAIYRKIVKNEWKCK